MSESRAPKYLIATGAALLYVALVGGGPGGPGTGPRPTTTTLDAGRAGGGGPAAALAPFTYTNAYGTVAVGDSSYPTFADSAIVEPYCSTALGLGAGVDAATATVTVTRTRRGSRATPVPFFDGSAWTLGFEDVGNYRVTVTVGVGAASRAENVTCRYVRRNLRRLSDEDRNAYFDAFKVLATVDSETGVRRFGPAYEDLNSFVGVHLALGGARENDALHDGMGFVTSHVALTAAFESALQAVAPATSVPYWDYTEDWHLAAASPGRELEALWALDVWGDDWFGTADGPYRTITRGRFAYTQIPNAPADAPWASPYGYLRSPWNCNADPFLMRSHSFCGANYEWSEGSLTVDANPIHTAWPGCKVHRELTFDTDSLYDWVWAAAYAPHGPVHFMIGGYAHCGDMEATLRGERPDANLGNLTQIVGNVKQAAVSFPKTLWRYGLVEYPKACSADAPQSECHMVCAHAVDVEPFKQYLLSGDMGSHMFGAWLSSFPEDLWEEFLELICTTPFAPGEQMGANSPVDPSFWPMHPTLDRLLQYKRLAKPFGSPAWENPRESEGQRTQYCISDNGNTITDCKGHHPYDVAPWKIHKLGADGNFEANASFVTNGELYDLSDPRDYRLPYVYDAFEWPHCDAAGYAFPPPPRDAPAPPGE